jgi:hypothetical protein
MKYSLDYKSDSKGFGSGYDYVSSPYRMNLHFQVRVKL